MESINQLIKQKNVINDDILLNVIQSSSNKYHDNLINLVDIANEIFELKLSFQGIMKIENLNIFHNLQKLYLDNNHISEICNIQSFKLLKWLDLSFNSIEIITGLNTLVLLEDLSLYNNHIKVIDGLDSCTNLTCLSLGNNKIDSLEQIMKLRLIKSLKVVSFNGNPISKLNEYRSVVLAYIDSLQYLDYALIDNDERENAKEQYHDALLDLKEKEEIVMSKLLHDKVFNTRYQSLVQARIAFAHDLFDKMISKDSDLQRLKNIPGVREIIDSYRSQYKVYSDDFIQHRLEIYESQQEEIKEFENILQSITSQTDHKAKSIVDNFQLMKKMEVDKISDMTNIQEKHRIVNKVKTDLDKAIDELFNIEIHQCEKLEKCIDDFDNKLVEAKSNALDTFQIYFRYIEDLELKYFDNLKLLLLDVIDKNMREELPEDYLDEESAVLIYDKESCIQLVVSTHDLHMSILLKEEDDSRNIELKYSSEMINKYLKDEQQRNRSRILEIHDFSQFQQQKIQLLLDDEDDDEDEANTARDKFVVE